MKIVEKNVVTGKERVLISHVPSCKTEDLRKYYIGRLYQTNRYNDYIVTVKPDGR